MKVLAPLLALPLVYYTQPIFNQQCPAFAEKEMMHALKQQAAQKEQDRPIFTEQIQEDNSKPTNELAKDYANVARNNFYLACLLKGANGVMFTLGTAVLVHDRALLTIPLSASLFVFGMGFGAASYGCKRMSDYCSKCAENCE